MRILSWVTTPYCRHYGHRDGVAPLANHPQRWGRRSHCPFWMILAPSRWASTGSPAHSKEKQHPAPVDSKPATVCSHPSTSLIHWARATVLSFAHSSLRLPGRLVQPVSPRSMRLPQSLCAFSAWVTPSSGLSVHAPRRGLFFILLYSTRQHLTWNN